MNIDLFLTSFGESGLVCDEVFPEHVSGVILDAETQELTLEFSQTGTTLHLNIPVEDEHREMMLFSPKTYIANMDDGLIAESIEVPIMYLNDPYGSDFGQSTDLSAPSQSLIRFEQFMKRCQRAQAVHRENLGDEASNSSVLRGLDPNALNYVPELVRQRMLEVGPQLANQANAPNAPLPSFGPGGGRGGPVTHPVRRDPRRTSSRKIVQPPKGDDSDQKD